MVYINGWFNMCFSPEVSFGSANCTSLIGLYGMTLVKSPNTPSTYTPSTYTSSTLPLAFLPLFFALHQALEGVLWSTYAIMPSRLQLLL